MEFEGHMLVMKYTVCHLRDRGIVSNEGKVVDYPELKPHQAALVIRKLLTVLNGDLAEYVSSNTVSGRSIMKPFPECVVYHLAVKMNDSCQ